MAKKQRSHLPLEPPTDTSETPNLTTGPDNPDITRGLWEGRRIREIFGFTPELENLWTQVETVISRWLEEHGYSAILKRPQGKSRASDAKLSPLEHVRPALRPRPRVSYSGLLFHIIEEQYAPMCELIATHGDFTVRKAAMLKDLEILYDAPLLAEQVRQLEKGLTTGRRKGSRDQNTSAQTRRDRWFALDDALLQNARTCNLSVEERAKRIHERGKWRVGKYPDGKPRYASVGTIKNAIKGRKKQYRGRASRTP